MIKRITLQNFKCFQEQALECRPITLLAGLNGMGKSTVIQSLLLLRQSYLQGLLDKEGLLLNGELVRLGTAKDVLWENASSDSIGFKFQTSAGDASWKFKYNRDSDLLERGLVNQIPSSFFSQALFNQSFQYLQAERIGPRTFFEVSDFVVRQRRQLGTKGEFAAHFLSQFGSSDIPNSLLAHDDAVSLSLRHQTEAWLSEVSPGTRIHVDSSPNLDIATLSYSFENGRQMTNQFRSTNVGFGLTYTLPILLALLSALPNSLITIENPEAHLHPRGQSRLGELIARAAANGVQIIFESHSDHVLNGIRLAVCKGLVSPSDVAIHFFSLSGLEEGPRTKVVSPRVDANGRVDHWPEGFFDEWDRSLEALINHAQWTNDET